MREVSCRVFTIFTRPLAERGVPLAHIVEGTKVPLSTLRDKNARIDWDDLCVIMRNLRKIFDEDDLRAIGRQYFRAPALRFLFVVARLRFTPVEFYRWINKPGDGGGNQIFTCIEPIHRELSERELEVDLIVADGYEVCWEFFLITLGNMEEMPRLLGYPAAVVSLTRLPRGGRFHIVIPERTPFLTKAKRALSLPLTVRHAGRELQEAHETLLKRYRQLDDARAQLDRQATRLRTAHSVNRLVHEDLDLDRTLDTMTHALIEEAGFAGVEIEVSATLETRQVARTWRRGGMATPPLCRTLAVQGGQRLGEVRAFPGPEADPRERDELLDFIVPTLTMALNNALSYLLAEDYRRGLERRVEERTRDLSAARDELTETVRRLEEVQQSRERLFANISHEIRTPLSLILLSVDSVLASWRERLDGGALEHLTTVTTSARKLVRLVDELLLLAAGHERELSITPVPTDLGLLLGEIVGGWRLAADVAGLTIELEVPPGTIARIDPVAIERVVSNLLSNAIKFTPPGGRIVVAVTPGAPIRLVVADTGLGIDEELRGRLFGRFEQGTGGRATRGGSGIGLSIVRELVRAHGGEVTCEPRAGGGTEFVLTLPAASTDAAPQPAPPPRLRPTDFGVPTSSEVPAPYRAPGTTTLSTIVVVEDDLALAEAIARTLAEEHVVHLAHDGVSGLALVEQHRPDLVVTDVQMPGMDGVELTRRIQDLPSGPPPPVLVLSARADLGDRLSGLEAGAVDYLTKPFDPSELRARVRAQLGHRALSQRLFRSEKLASLGAMSAGLAHELRNPANAIVNAIGPLRELLPPELTQPDEPVAQLLDVMSECAAQVGFLARQLLGFRRSGDLELKRVPVQDLVGRALSNASAALSEVEVRTRLDYAGTVRCSPPMLTQVLVNLLENAAHAAGKGGWVELAVAPGAAGRVALDVTDSGPGVPPPLREKIFEPFFTTKPPGQGTGLGLSTSRDLIHRHGGTLELRLRGDRTVFSVELPEPAELQR